MKKFLRFISGFAPVVALINLSKIVKPPGFNGLPLFDVVVFFISRITQGELQIRARSLAFSFLLGFFPAIIFIFTLIPYIPIPQFQDQLLELIKTFFPANTYEMASETIEDIVRHQRSGLLSFGFIFSLIVSTNGILALMQWFNKSYHGLIKRQGWKMRLIAIGLTLILSLFVIMAIALIIGSELIYHYLTTKPVINSILNIIILQGMKWLILLLLCFSAISLLYYFGPSEHQYLKFISAGSTLATVLFVFTSLGFNYYVTHLAHYNKLYGSIGTLIIIMIWLYINSLVLLVGFELNVAIRKAGIKRVIPPASS